MMNMYMIAPSLIAVESCPVTDDTPTRGGRYATNWELSVYRGNAVLDYLLSKNLSPERFFVGGYGSTRPLYPNSDGDRKHLNRRVEIILKHLQEL